MGYERYLVDVRVTFRDGLYAGVSVLLLCGIFLTWLWQPERQVQKHVQTLFHQIEAKRWDAVSDLIANDYRDQWSQDRLRMVERMREVMRYLREMHIISQEPILKIDNRDAVWTAKVTIEGEAGEAMDLIKERINSLPTPFELQWRRVSSKPWDWKLVRVTNSELQLPPNFE